MYEIFLLCNFIVSHSSVRVCVSVVSPQGDFWFSEKIEMDQSALPLGVAWHPENETITNSSQTPFIIVLENNAIYPHELPQELQDVGYRVSDPYTGVYIIKFQDSNSYRWATEHASNEPANPSGKSFLMENQLLRFCFHRAIFLLQISQLTLLNIFNNLHPLKIDRKM